MRAKSRNTVARSAAATLSRIGFINCLSPHRGRCTRRTRWRPRPSGRRAERPRGGAGLGVGGQAPVIQPGAQRPWQEAHRVGEAHPQRPLREILGVEDHVRLRGVRRVEGPRGHVDASAQGLPPKERREVEEPVEPPGQGRPGARDRLSAAAAPMAGSPTTHDTRPSLASISGCRILQRGKRPESPAAPTSLA